MFKLIIKEGFRNFENVFVYYAVEVLWSQTIKNFWLTEKPQGKDLKIPRVGFDRGVGGVFHHFAGIRIRGGPLFCGRFRLWENVFRGYRVPRVARDCWYHILGGVFNSDRIGTL